MFRFSDKSGTSPRQQLLVDRDVQGAVMWRLGMYMGVCVTYFTVIQLFTQSLLHPQVELAELLSHFFDDAVFWLPGLLVLVPVMVLDLLQLTNRFTGPIFSLRREIQALINGKTGRRISFRQSDYWSSMAAQFNAVRDELVRLRGENQALQDQLAQYESLRPDEPAASDQDPSSTPPLGDDESAPTIDTDSLAAAAE